MEKRGGKYNDENHGDGGASFSKGLNHVNPVEIKCSGITSFLLIIQEGKRIEIKNSAYMRLGVYSSDTSTSSRNTRNYRE
jgi:hypothetical protein